ncbi:MAG: hypothetical protein QW314_02240 [Thermoproteota archaeon]
MEEGIEKLENLVYWARCILGSLLGIIFAIFWRPYLGSVITAASIALLVFLVSYYVTRWILGEARVNLLGGKNKIYTIGIGAYFTAWLFFWILFYTLFFHGTSG